MFKMLPIYKFFSYKKFCNAQVDPLRFWFILKLPWASVMSVEDSRKLTGRSSFILSIVLLTQLVNAIGR